MTDKPMVTDRMAAIERAIRSGALALHAKTQTPAQVLAALTAAVEGDRPSDITPRERTAAAHQSRKQKMLAELLRYEQQGRGREAANLVARKFASDPLDPVEVGSLERSLRRWRPARKKTDNVRSESLKRIRFSK